MQSICSVLGPECAALVVDARAAVCEDPVIGAIYDPPFAHFTHQLAEDYDWDGLGAALQDFASRHEPFAVHTSGLYAFTGRDGTLAVAGYRSEALIAYHAELWETVLPFAKGRTRKLDEPPTWTPHVTIKRCGTEPERFGGALARLAQKDFVWTTTVDNVMVQCDPAQNSLTHYQRICLRLGGAKPGARAAHLWNGDIIEMTQGSDDSGAYHEFRVKLDNGGLTEHRVSAPTVARLMAEACASWVYFVGGRCCVEAGSLVAIDAKTPMPVVF